MIQAHMKTFSADVTKAQGWSPWSAGSKFTLAHPSNTHRRFPFPFPSEMFYGLFQLLGPILTSPTHSCHIAVSYHTEKTTSSEEFPKLLPLTHLLSSTWTSPSLLAHILLHFQSSLNSFSSCLLSSQHL